MSEERKDQTVSQEQDPKARSEHVAKPKLEDLDPQESGENVAGGGNNGTNNPPGHDYR